MLTSATTTIAPIQTAGHGCRTTPHTTTVMITAPIMLTTSTVGL